MAKDSWEETGDSCSDWELLGLGLSLNNNLFKMMVKNNLPNIPSLHESKPYLAYFKALILDLSYSI